MSMTADSMPGMAMGEEGGKMAVMPPNKPVKAVSSSLGDTIFFNITRAFALIALLMLAGIIVSLVYAAWPSIQKYGLPFVLSVSYTHLLPVFPLSP